MNNKDKIGTHNTMSYLSPKQWWMKPFHFVAKCQNLTLEEQYNLGCRMFDMRVKFNKEGEPHFRHGMMAFKGDVYETLKLLNDKSNDADFIYVRFILESKIDSFQKEHFIEFCKNIERDYPNIGLFCGRDKYTWEQLYKFKLDDIYDIWQPVSSLMWKKIDDWFPWLYAHFMNRKNYKKWDRKQWISLDFIENVKDLIG